MGNPSLSELGSLGFSVNSAIESGYRDAISLDELSAALESRTVFDLMESRVPNGVSWSAYESDSMSGVLERVSSGTRPRDVGIEASGLHWLLALIIEAMQQRFWVSK